MKRRGIMVIDAVVALGIIAALGTALVVAINQGHRASARLANQRGAVWAAEAALAQLQAGQPENPEGVEIEPLSDTTAPAGFTWVRVRAKHGGRTATLIGVVPLRAKGQQP
jgi:type II secretory pathway pseudopilin PulG